jgi:ankyrin repeat protein
VCVFRIAYLFPRSDSPKIAQLLLDAGAEVNAVNHNLVTPIHIATCLGHPNVLETLCAVPSANLNLQVRKFTSVGTLSTLPPPPLQDDEGDTPFHKASFSRNSECLRSLLRRGADPTICDPGLISSLHKVVARGDLA